MDVNNPVKDAIVANASTTAAQDFLDPAFLPPPPFINNDEMPEEAEDDTRLQAPTPATGN